MRAMNYGIKSSQDFQLNKKGSDVKGPQLHHEAATSRRQQEKEPPAEEDENQLWSIDDDTLFYPIGLQAHGNSAGKCVFVTWSADYLLNFVFKFSRTQKSPKLTKVRLAIEADDEISDLLITELNTLLLMRSGRVYYFSSVKSIHPVDWLDSGVRCMSLAPAGFSLIRVQPDNSITLELYQDVLLLGKSNSTLLQSYDITFDSNTFNCKWLDDRFTLLTQAVLAEEHLAFMRQLIHNACELHVQQKLHFFTVSGHVFVLIPVITDPQEVNTSPNHKADCHIQLLCSYASDVTSLHILPDRQCCMVFLECGTIDIWYMSRLTCCLRRQSHHTGSQYTYCQFAMGNGCFYYTNERQVAQLSFSYCADKDVICVRESFKSVPGIVVVTWSHSFQQLVCLSCNNIFYRLTFDSTRTDAPSDIAGSANEAQATFENINELYELTSSRLTELLQKAQIVQQLSDMPQQLHAAIERECVTQQLLAVGSKAHIYKGLCQASLQFWPHMPPASHFAAHSILLSAGSPAGSAYMNACIAMVLISITRNAIFDLPPWQLHLQLSNGSAYSLHFPVAQMQSDATIYVTLPLVRPAYDLLPSFFLQLCTFLPNTDNVPHNQLAITVPVELQMTASSYAELFGPVCRMPLSQCIEQSLHGLVTQFNKATKTEKSSQPWVAANAKAPYTCSLHLSSPKLYDRIAQSFLSTGLGGQPFTLHFMSAAPMTLQRLGTDADSRLQIDSSDAISLYYMKLYLSKLLTSQMVPSTSNTATLMQYQCAVERCYGALLQQLQSADSETGAEQPSEKHMRNLANLQRIYAKLRTSALKSLTLA